MLHGCPLSLDAWGRLNVVIPFHHLSEDQPHHLPARSTAHYGIFAQTLAERGDEEGDRVGRCAGEDHRRLLRSRDERPSDGRAASKDEIATSHSITSSARA